MSTPNRSIAEYYARRAAEYERIYARPERQHDLRRLERRIVEYFAGRSVLEVACGTGYWTEQIARSATAVAAFDCNTEVLDIARRKSYGNCPVELVDNLYVEGNSTPISRHDEEGNTYQTRTLDDGSIHEVLKDFADRDQIEQAVRPFAAAIEVKHSTYYWMATYTLM